MHRNNSLVWLTPLALICALSVGCGESSDHACTQHSDCESNFCKSDGTCAASEDGGAPDAGDSGIGGDASIDANSAPCTPNHDGILSRDEFPLEPGRSATYRVALNAPVSTAGQINGDERRWEFSTNLESDRDIPSTLRSPDGEWFASLFEGASYVTRLSEENNLLGVFELNNEALLLRGVVSPEPGLTRTELIYTPPVVVIRFPLQTSSAWSHHTSVSGVADGIAVLYSEQYEFNVDAQGDIETPFGTFPVLRLRTELQRTFGAFVTTNRTFNFLAECFTFVATVRSSDFETDVEFTTAAEVRRLAP